MLKIYEPTHDQNRMGHEGDLDGARTYYLEKNNKNLNHLIRGRFAWMNSYIAQDQTGVELRAGIGASKDFIDCRDFSISDFNNADWLDLPNIDALQTGFIDNKYDFVIASNLIHHLAKPSLFFHECNRILKPHGYLLIQEINTSLFMRLVLRLMRHEGFNDTTDVFNPDQICNNPDDPWSANCSIPKLLFSDHGKFEEIYTNFEIVQDRKSEFLVFLNSGGVIAKTKFLPLGERGLRVVDKIDRILIGISERLFPLQRQIVLRKRK